MLTMSLTLMLAQAALPGGDELLAMPLEKQRAVLAALSKPERTQVVRGLSIDQLVLLESRAAKALGTYRAKVTRAERVNGRMLEPETMSVWVKNEPIALRLETLTGPRRGRSVLYNVDLRRDELRAREAGLLSLVGGVWIGLDSGFARADSNHRVTDLGFVAATELIGRIMRQTQALGPMRRTWLRTDEAGVCERFNAPAGTKGLYATNSVICFDPISSLPLHFEIADERGPLERYTWSEVEPVSVAPDFFSLAAEGL